MIQPSGFNISFFDMQKARRNFSTSRKYVVGYARLSFDEDGDGFVSIENQMSILEEFYHMHYEDATSDYTFIADDNVSGYKFERDGLYELITLIENGKCNIIIAKDLSRIGRHGALTQLFIEQCERVGIKIHAMSDYDSTKESDDLILGIRAWSNERVVKDASAKIKKIVRHKQANGTWFCAAPFGYYVIDYQKGKVGIDNEAASIVRRIFDMYLNGIGVASIARALTKEHVPTPNMIRRERSIENGEEFNKKVSTNWTASFVSQILSNEFYIGTLVTGRYKRDGINGKDVRTNADAWNRFENHHEAIIDKSTFDAAQEIKKSHIKYNFRSKNDKEHLFHGIVYCGDCGSVQYAYSRKNLATQYVCSNYFKYGKERCTRHSIRESMLIDITIDFLKLARTSCADAIESLDGELLSRQAVKDNRKTIESAEQEIAALESKIRVIEEQRIKQIIAHPERESDINAIYDQMIEDSQQKKDALSEQIEQMKNNLSTASTSIKKARTAIEIIDQVIESKTLTRRAVEAIFDRITVYENGNIDIKLKPYLQMLDPKNYTVEIKPPKHAAETYEVRTERDEADSEEDDIEANANDICDGSPSYASFAQAVNMMLSVNKLANHIALRRDNNH